MKLTNTDRDILASYASCIEGLSDYLGSGYEIILHSLENLDSSVIAIQNGYHSGRSLGAPVTNLALEMLSEIENDGNHRKYKSYDSCSRNGTPLRSSTIPIMGENGRTIGLLCINFYTDTPFSEVFRIFGNVSSGKDEIKEHFASVSDDLIVKMVEEIKEMVYSDTTVSSVNKNKEVISILYNKGVFNLKDSVQKVADSLAVSKNTVYLHLRSFRAP